ncbi:MAG: P1 family peptidase [Agathobacter sp.]|nr:P1 family peptidase [Agathobacter sp.]
MKEINIMEIGGFKVGHAQDYDAMTGCTVVLCDDMAPAGVDVRGGGPASRETPLLNPVSDAKGIHAVLLSGGSAFGLDAAGGVMKYLEERNIGFDVGITKVPLVCQSCLFDLGIGKVDVRPEQKMGYEACENASYEPMEEGNVGAGTGCTVGKIKGMQDCMKSGIGSFAVQVGDLKVGAIVAVNALGDVYDLETGKMLAGVRDESNNMCSTEEIMIKSVAKDNLFTGNTTIGIVLTNAKMDKTHLNKVASMAHNGYARTIRPIHTTADGDSIYALSVGAALEGDVNVVGTLSSYVMAKAINRAVLAAESACGYPAARDM